MPTRETGSGLGALLEARDCLGRVSFESACCVANREMRERDLGGCSWDSWDEEYMEGGFQGFCGWSSKDGE